ncbi:hypothetical protein [Paludisphaera mucosa]|uniref:DUF1398 domain-containing protein n=1 Tax=Paludisphaera mucosa TaxID=3030827 RepID=A0ABT6FBS9_9BACT|nr:hypothetical protein [Paludisphaera mucosa]MDG3005022.1 hypothetical protein [Paludisphaera mucosa]
MDATILHDCLTQALAGRITFPEVVGRLLATGVERYDADLARMELRHYAAAGAIHVEPLPLADAPAVPRTFSAEGVRSAVAAAQGREVDYPGFLRRIMAAGTVGYTAFLGGRRVVYFGRDGDCHVEPFSGPR